MDNQEDYTYYKILLEEHERGMAISLFLEKMKELGKAADQLARELGAESRTEAPNATCAGLGIGSLIFTKPQSSKKYQRIGSRGKKIEYIPNMNQVKGKKIAGRIADLPTMSSAEFRASFGIPKDATLSPAWFVSGNFMYLKCRYAMGEEFVAIEEKEFEEEREKINH